MAKNITPFRIQNDSVLVAAFSWSGHALIDRRIFKKVDWDGVENIGYNSMLRSVVNNYNTTDLNNSNNTNYT